MSRCLPWLLMVQWESGGHTEQGSPLPPGRWWVLLDAAKACATHPPDLHSHPADFVALSFYKIFGFPTGAVMGHTSACTHRKTSPCSPLESGREMIPGNATPPSFSLLPSPPPASCLRVGPFATHTAVPAPPRMPCLRAPAQHHFRLWTSLAGWKPLAWDCVHRM